MNDNLHDLFAKEMSDETTYHLGNFLYELALVFESAHLGQIRRYNKSRIELRSELMDQNSNQSQSINEEEELQDSLF
jgi:hypothetical protein